MVLPVAQAYFTVLQMPKANSTGTLYTLGMGPCIGLALRAYTNAGYVIALAHADSSTDVSAALVQMTSEAEKLAGPLLNKTLMLMGGRVSAEGEIREQFSQILGGIDNFEEKSEMCTLLSPDPAAGMVTGGLVSTEAPPSLIESLPSSPFACAEELLQNAKETKSNIDSLRGKVITLPLPKLP